MATNEALASNKISSAAGDESSESDGETEPAKSFHRCFSTNKNIKSSVSIGYLYQIFVRESGERGFSLSLSSQFQSE